jgi:pimeloyl-ACP methyl ester carboxylesterase
VYTKLGQLNIPLYYELRGPVKHEDPAIVFINGWCLSGRYWEEAVRRLAYRYRTLTFDMRGFGRSRNKGSALPSNSHVSVDTGADEGEALIQKFGLIREQPVHIVGHSLGGLVASRLATRLEKKGKLASLTIVNSGAFSAEEQEGAKLIPFMKVFVNIKKYFDLPFIRDGVVSRSVNRPIGPIYEQILVEDLVDSDKLLALDLSISSLEKPNLDLYQNELEELKAPLLLIVGDKDNTIPPKGMYNIKRFKPESELVSFPDCGHLPMLEQPDRFAAVLHNHFSLKGLPVLARKE